VKGLPPPVLSFEVGLHPTARVAITHYVFLRRIMKNVILTLVVASMMMTLAGTSRADDRNRATKEDLDDRIHSLNETAKKNHAENAAMHGISVETGVPMEKLRAIVERRKVSPAGLMVACVIADNTKEDPEYVVRKASSKTWAALVREYGVPYDKVERRLARLETYIRSGGDQRPVERRERRD